MTGNMATDWRQDSLAISSLVATLPVLPGKNRTPWKKIDVFSARSAPLNKASFFLHGVLQKVGNTGNLATSDEIAQEFCCQSFSGTGNTGNIWLVQP